MNSALCILTEGDHNVGVGVLVNSLCRNEYQGTIWVGYRGSPPVWAPQQASTTKGWQVSSGVVLHLIEIGADVHLGNLKPQFMLDVCKLAPDAQLLFYCDTDIVLNGKWNLVEKWVSGGCLVVEHSSRCRISHHHPHRQAWAAQVVKCGYGILRPLDEHINSGFIGVPRDQTDILTAWQKITDSLKTEGYDLVGFQCYPSSHPWKNLDQATLNAALMATQSPLSILDSSAMDFGQDGYLLSHAAGNGKPWRGNFVRSALKGVPPQKPAEIWCDYLDGPVKVLSALSIRKLRISLRLASLIGRVYRHPMFSYYPG